MADTDEQDTIVHLVAALRTHIAQEEEERQRNPEAWLATLEARTQQQWIIQECLRNECETREEQDAAAPCPAGDGTPGLETHPSAPDPCPSHEARATMPAPFAQQDAARSSRTRGPEASRSPRRGRRDRLEALEISLQLLHTKVDTLLVYLERQAQEV